MPEQAEPPVLSTPAPQSYHSSREPGSAGDAENRGVGQRVEMLGGRTRAFMLRLAAMTGMRAPEALADLIMAAGFDARDYLARFPDIAAAGFDADTAVLHFLTHGHAESRDPRFGPLGQGLADLAAASIPERDYHRRLFRCVVHAQLRHADTHDHLWNRWNPRLPNMILGMGGLPYVVLGDSHATTYVMDAVTPDGWLAGLPLTSGGATLAGLGRVDDDQGRAARVLRWVDGLGTDPLAPVLLKFGGIDAEFRWYARRVRAGMWDIDLGDFDRHAGEAIAAYTVFLGRLMTRPATREPVICSVYPPSAAEPDRVRYLLVRGMDPRGEQPGLAARVEQMAIPDFHGRAALRRLFNAHLRAMAEGLGLAFLDTFTPLLNRDGVTDARYLPPVDQDDPHLRRQPLAVPIGRAITDMLAVLAGGAASRSGP